LHIQRKQIISWSSAEGARKKRDALAVEEPLEIRVDTQSVCVTMRTPGDDEEMAAGFLLSEALITQKEDIRRIELHRRNRLGNVVDVSWPRIKVVTPV
jgi:FdhD protein